jgi:hypothetical protein
MSEADTGLHEANRLAHEVARIAVALRDVRNTELLADDFAEWCRFREEERLREADLRQQYENALDEYQRTMKEEN